MGAKYIIEEVFFMQIGEMETKGSVVLRRDSVEKILKDLKGAESHATARKKVQLRKLRHTLGGYATQQEGNGHIKISPLLFQSINTHV